MKLSGVTLETLRTALQVTGMQIEELKRKFPDHTSGTGYTLDHVGVEVEHCYSRIEDEILALRRAGQL